MSVQTRSLYLARLAEDISPKQERKKRKYTRRNRQPEPEAVEERESGVVECLGMRLCPNKKWLYAIVGDEKVAVFAGNRIAERLVGKPFQATIEIAPDGEKQYTHLPE